LAAPIKGGKKMYYNIDRIANPPILKIRIGQATAKKSSIL
jgi:hypothetical protein